MEDEFLKNLRRLMGALKDLGTIEAKEDEEDTAPQEPVEEKPDVVLIPTADPNAKTTQLIPNLPLQMWRGDRDYDTETYIDFPAQNIEQIMTPEQVAKMWDTEAAQQEELKYSLPVFIAMLRNMVANKKK